MAPGSSCSAGASEPIEDCAKAIRDAGGEAFAISADIREPDRIEAAMQRIKSEFGGLNILVNNAGGQFVTPRASSTTRALRP